MVNLCCKYWLGYFLLVNINSNSHFSIIFINLLNNLSLQKILEKYKHDIMISEYIYILSYYIYKNVLLFPLSHIVCFFYSYGIHVFREKKEEEKKLYPKN